jgi:hypothetical protein
VVVVVVVVVVVLWMRSNSSHPYSKEEEEEEEAGVDQGTHLHESMKRWTNFGVLEVVVGVAGDLEPEH